MVVTHGALRPARDARRGCALTIGNFDGVHRGHRALVERVVAEAREHDLASCVLSFEPHPRELLSPAQAPARLTRLRDKLELLSRTGVSRVHVLRFDARCAAMAPERFVEEGLLGALGVRWLIVGRDFRFGARRGGDFALLERLGQRHGFALEAMPDVVAADGERISSSGVREALARGDFARAERLLGHRYFISGHVAHGAKLGRELGFPTANIPLRRAPPLSGIYVVEVEGYGPGVASVGRRPTVNPVPVPLLEVHLLGRDEPLYGRCLRVGFLKKLRDEAKFDGLGPLREAIARDAREAKEYFEKHG